MAYAEKGRVWEDYLEKVNKTINGFCILNQNCEDTIKVMYLVHAQILECVKRKWGERQLPNSQLHNSLIPLS